MALKLSSLILSSLIVLLSMGPAQAELFTIDRYSNTDVLVTETLYTMPDVGSLDWTDFSNANIVSLGGWGTIPEAEWISELTGATGPPGSYRVYRMEITLPENAINMTGSIEYMVDDYIWIYANKDLVSQNTTYGNWNTLSTFDFSSSLTDGLSSIVLDLVVKNSGSSYSNPLGLTFHTSLSGEIDSVQRAATPEPGTMALLGSAGALLAWLRRRRRQDSS